MMLGMHEQDSTASADAHGEGQAVAARRGLSVEEVAPAALLRARAEGRAAARAEKVGA